MKTAMSVKDVRAFSVIYRCWKWDSPIVLAVDRDDPELEYIRNFGLSKYKEILRQPNTLYGFNVRLVQVEKNLCGNIPTSELLDELRRRLGVAE